MLWDFVSVFGMLLGDTLILDNLDNANAYRQEVSRSLWYYLTHALVALGITTCMRVHVCVCVCVCMYVCV